MNHCWNFLGNAKVQVDVPRGPRLLPSAPFTLYVYCVNKGGLGFSLSKQVFDMQDIVLPVSNKNTVWLLLTLTGKLAAYLLSLSFTSIISWFCNIHSQSEAEYKT